MAIICTALNIFILLSNATVLVTFSKLEKLKVQHSYILAPFVTDLTVLAQNTAITAMLINREIKLTNTVGAVIALHPIFSTTVNSLAHICLTIDRWISVNHPPIIQSHTVTFLTVKTFESLR